MPDSSWMLEPACYLFLLLTMLLALQCGRQRRQLRQEWAAAEVRARAYCGVR